MQEENVNSVANIPETPQKKEQTALDKIKNYFSASRLAFLGVFTAVAFALYFLEIPLMAWTPLSFLKLDFSNVFVLVTGFALGPIAAVVVCVIKEILHALILSQTVGVGELANILLTLPYVLIPAIIYKKHKGIKPVLISLLIASVAQVIVSVPVNWFLNFPFFLNLYAGTPWKEGMAFYQQYWYFAVLFNLLKTVILSAVTLVIYKPLSKLIKRTNAKFNEIKNKKQAKL